MVPSGPSDSVILMRMSVALYFRMTPWLCIRTTGNSLPAPHSTMTTRSPRSAALRSQSKCLSCEDIYGAPIQVLSSKRQTLGRAKPAGHDGHRGSGSSARNVCGVVRDVGHVPSVV